MALYLGLDVHGKATVYVAMDQAGQVVRRGSVATTPEGLARLLAEAQAPAGTRVGLETGAQATWVARLLTAAGMDPAVIDAREVRAKARRRGQKTDGRDAFEIADGVRRGTYVSIVYVPPVEVERLRKVLSRRRHFVKVATMQAGAAKFLLRQAGRGAELPTLTTEAAWAKLVASPKAEGLREHLAMHAALWRLAREQVAALERELGEALAPFRETEELLTTVPGVGRITAASFLAVLGTPGRFPDGGAVGSYLGLVPSTYDSGESERHGRITRQGSGPLRAVLVEAAHHAANPRHPLHPYFARVCAKAGYKKAVVAVAHRLARILFRMWRTQTAFDVAKLNVEAVRETRTKTVYYRIRTAA
jgi:transposase